MVEEATQVEVLANLHRHQPKQFVTHRSAAEQFGMTPPDFAGAGPAEPEDQATVLDQPVDLVEQGRDLLDLVNEQQRAARGIAKLIAQEAGLPGVPGKLLAAQQVPDRGVRVAGLEQAALAGLSGAPEEEALGRLGGGVRDLKVN